MKLLLTTSALFFLFPALVFAELQCVTSDDSNLAVLNSNNGKVTSVDQAEKKAKKKIRGLKTKLRKQKQQGAAKKAIARTKNKLRNVRSDLELIQSCTDSGNGGAQNETTTADGVILGSGPVVIHVRSFKASSGDTCYILPFVQFDDVPGVEYSQIGYTFEGVAKTQDANPPSYSDDQSIFPSDGSGKIDAAVEPGKHQVLIKEAFYSLVPIRECDKTFARLKRLLSSPQVIQ